MGPLETNTYLLKLNGQAIIIDPSFTKTHEYQTILDTLGSDDLIAIVCTHGHVDHIAGIPQILTDYDIPVYINPLEQHFLSEPSLNLSSMMGQNLIINADVKDLNVGANSIGEFNFEVINTPGHTAGCQSFFFGEHVFCGDFIFRGSVGRMDFPTGSQRVMLDSLKKFVNTYQDQELILYPGHGDNTTLDLEIATNPYIHHVIN